MEIKKASASGGSLFDLFPSEGRIFLGLEFFCLQFINLDGIHMPISNFPVFPGNLLHEPGHDIPLFFHILYYSYVAAADDTAIKVV